MHRTANHADRVKCACLAHLVNTIAPIMTEEGGAASRQTIFFPFADMANLGHGSALRAKVESPGYSARYYDPRDNAENVYPIENVPYLKFSAVHDAEGGHVTLFALNRHLTQPMTMNVDLKGFERLAVEKGPINSIIQI